VQYTIRYDESSRIPVPQRNACEPFYGDVRPRNAERRRVVSRSDNLSRAQSLMLDFADRTGLLTRGIPPRRYLWTDSFAVCNFFELYRQTGENRFRDLALALIDQVHETLGRHRPDDVRRGWISGLSGEEGRRHPTAGGLRIGKVLPERRPDEPPDDRLEWDQDGQYFHYLTKWMHALHRAGRVTGDGNFRRMARELARAAHARFVYRPSSGASIRMYWKMSIDLTRPVVPSMGHHDPLDGLITYYELLPDAGAGDSGPDLKAGIKDFSLFCRNRDWSTDDPLGLGGLLADAYRVAQLILKGSIPGPELLEDIISSARAGLKFFFRRKPLDLPAHYRLPFREFGLSIGLKATAELDRLAADNRSSFAVAHVAEGVKDILRYAPFAETIEDFWLEPVNQRGDTWTEHRDINEVMLATSLAPDGFLAV